MAGAGGADRRDEPGGVRRARRRRALRAGAGGCRGRRGERSGAVSDPSSLPAGAVPVHATLRAYRAAVAELPASTTLAPEPHASVVVVPGTPGWPDAVRVAVVPDPAPAPTSELRALHVEVAIPVVLERPRLRPDDAAKAVASREEGDGLLPANALTREAEGTEDEMAGLVRDALGWLRVLACADLGVLSGWSSPSAGLALLDAGAS